MPGPDGKRITIVNAGALNRLDVLRNIASQPAGARCPVTHHLSLPSQDNVEDLARTFAADQPRMPGRVARLPHCPRRGIPVPWFVAWEDRTQPADFRISSARKIAEAHARQLCWVCGEALAGRRAFVIGPMCAINRISSEPPSHEDCADYSARTCPFLVRPHMRRRPDLMQRIEAGELDRGAGEGHLRNPGVVLVWLTHSYGLVGDRRGARLFRVGHPLETRWYTEGRQATRHEAAEAMLAGVQEVTLPAAAAKGPKAVAALQGMLDTAWGLLPKGEGLKAAPRLLVDPQVEEAIRAGASPSITVASVPPANM
jgi:hypothetical protein